MKCSFTDHDITNNITLLQHYDNYNIVKKQHYFDHNDNPDKDPKPGSEKYFSKIIKETIDNQEWYCGYWDKIDKPLKARNKGVNRNALMLRKAQISCSNCFEIISDEIIDSSGGYYTCASLNNKNAVKDYTMTYTPSSFAAEYPNIRIHQLFNERKEENVNMLVIVKCVNCSNVIGVDDGITGNKILFNCI